MIPWKISKDDIEIRFLGRTAPSDREQALLEEGISAVELATLRQVHSSRVLPASPGLCGEGDALWTTRRKLALSVTTADCVPLVVADQKRLAVIHAGWRGIVAGVVPATLAALGSSEGLAAWIGPAIGACCYEVGEDIAAALVSATSPSVTVAVSVPGRRPHVDLCRAVDVQLRRAGVSEVHTLGHCTRCRKEELWSYRRSGAAAGRNLTLAWLSAVNAGGEGCA
ncbi:MAG: polyphenol oxidase family protein [Acidobacteriota bacterium]|nr:polyphenol oxidase family protein [Acidobacteriota bacterium]